MKIKAIFSCALIVAIFLTGCSESKISNRKVKDLDVIEPLRNLKAAFDTFKTTNLDPVATVDLIFALIPCILQAIVSPTNLENTSSASGFPSPLNFHWNDSQSALIAESLVGLTLPKNLFLAQNDPDPCMPANFPEIHEFVWVKSNQLEDLVHFLGKSGYPDIYTDIKDKVYEDCPDELTKVLPKPKSTPTSRNTKSFNAGRKLPNVRERVLNTMKTPLQEESTCQLGEIISKVLKSGLLNLIQFISSVTKEFNTSPGLHFLVGKIQEPAKGASVREFHELDSVNLLLEQAHAKLIGEPTWNAVFSAIKKAIGLDFTIINPIEMILSLVEYILWGIPK